jgi:hypothetical protein
MYLLLFFLLFRLITPLKKHTPVNFLLFLLNTPLFYKFKLAGTEKLFNLSNF